MSAVLFTEDELARKNHVLLYRITYQLWTFLTSAEGQVTDFKAKVAHAKNLSVKQSLVHLVSGHSDFGGSTAMPKAVLVSKDSMAGRKRCMLAGTAKKS